MPRLALPRSLLARNIALLIALVMLSQVCSLAVLLHYVQRPRVERTAVVFARYVTTLDELFQAAPDSARDALIERLNNGAQPPGTDEIDPPQSLLHFYITYQREVFLETLRQHLPADMQVRWQTEGGQRLWIKIHSSNSPAWIALPIPEDARGAGLDAAIVLSLGLAVLAALTGYLIQLHLNRPLRNLAHAARRVSSGDTPPPLPTDGPTEIAEVSSAFNQMTQTLQQAEATRAVMLAGISHDIRTPLTKLRLAMAMAITDQGDDNFVVAAEAYLDQIDTILQQFMDYAGSGERETAQPGDLNALVSRLAADFAGLGHEFALSLGPLPEFAFRPITMMRLLMNLMQNAVVYGRVGLAVRTWVQNGSAYVAVCDRGEGLAPQELEALKAPFQRGRNARSQSGGTGLGLAIVERIARLHGGSLQFHAREGGGLEVWVVLPLHA
ncbi:two-component system, OmpR family, osmolarity sensor histidine kinase EnvZ [Paraburkholderia phenazinium]|jgi:two-component system osmolarity sensor histidine kinase EnvZ|uniref:histidine kinase n=2 Tax=Paraburkholderia phenazinium TaxID=60549 RepID=A0A1G8P644_9BURK|nr:two-component system, OmpR family, osmolarity sensor histidine kinase EnvZ [Paraburkholderia phenazinium]